MKQIKRLTTLALAVMLLLSLATTAFAADPNSPVTGPFTVTIKNATGHTYQIYQIFTGDLSQKQIAGATTPDNTEDDKYAEVLSNIVYGADFGGAENFGKEVPEAVLEDVKNKVNNDPSAIVLTGTGATMTTTGDTATYTAQEAGYYMIVDVTDPLPEGHGSSAIIVQVVGLTEINSKHSSTTIVKKVQDINDTTGEQPKDGDSEWIDSADYDIGDKVPFKSTATFEGMANYTTYKVTFTDIMAEGLTYNNDMKVLVNGVDCTTSFTITPTTGYTSNDEYNGGTQIIVTCDDIKVLKDADDNSIVANDATIVLEYSATLNSVAKLGAPGNPNKIKVTTKPDGTGETPWDVNIVFTFRVEADKYTTVNGQKVPLAGAGFTLYKEVKNANTTGAKTGAAIKAELALQNPSIKADALKANSSYIVVANVDVDAAGDTFGFNGIDDGNYVLVETTIPAGYNAWDAKEFTVTAAHEIVSDDPDLTTLSGGDLFTGTVSTGILKTEVENNAGVELPETGGMGTTIFYVLGGMMVLVAVVLLVTKKRMASAE